MKSKCSFILKSSIALLLAVLMLFGSISTVLAATVDMVASGWNNTTWYLGNDIAKVWDNSASNCTMTKDDTVKFYYDLYLKTTDADVYYRPYEKDNYAMGPTAGNNTKVTTTGTAGSGYNDGRCWYFDTAECTASKYNKIRIWIDTSGNNGNGWSWYEKTAISNISPTLTVPSTGTVGTAITLTGGSTDTNKIGALTKTYQYSTNNGSTWTDLASGSYTATSAGTVKFRYKVSDAGVKTSGSGTNGRTARVEYSSEQSCTFSAAATTYTSISAAAKGSTDGSNFNTTLSGTPATISANSYTTGTSALTINAGTVSGYSFYKWVVTAGSGTIGSATTANTTFTPSASSTTVTAQYKKNYTITKNTPTSGTGTISIDNTSRVAGQQYVVTLAPAAGYKVDTFTVGGVDKKSSISNNKYTGTASGSDATIAVNVTYAPITDMQLYIAGRFRVRPSAGSSSWTTTYASGSDWNATSTNIPFTYLSGTTYKVDTYATLAELSADIGSSSYTGNPVFFVYDTTNSKNWYASSATTMSTSGTTLVSSGGANSNLKFSSTSTDGPVTIYYDANTHKIWYTIPDLYNVTVGSVTGGSVTASSSRCEANTTVTLTITPTTGYQLKSITAKDSSNASVTLSGTGNTRTFTMPAKDVTVTPVFEKITWSGLTAVGKYSTTAANDASYSNAMSPNPATIDATSATQLDGVKVTAPATDPTGYVFAGWYTATGSFTAPNDKETTFKPNAANAVAIAKYKKLFTITSSVDNTGTGAGTASTNVTSVVAGGSYTITATPKSGSAVESVKVNGTTKTAASQTISSVSADQTVVVKFKSNVYLRGGSTIGTNWTTGDAMTSNAAGTEFTKTYENVAGSSSGTQYQFKLYVDGYNNDGTATINITGGASTGTCTHQSSGDQNYVLTLKKAANVTVKSNGTKITEIKVVPANATKYAVTFKKAANTTITGQYEGTNFSTASADAVVQVYEGDEISFTVTAASGYHISALTSGTTPTFSPAVTKTYKLSNVTATKMITPTAAADVNVTAKTNKSSRGTVSIDKTKSYKGDTVKITVTPLTGSLKTLTATYGNGKTYEYKNSNWSEVLSGTTANNAFTNVFLNPAKAAFGIAATGAAPDSAATGASIDEAAMAAMPDIVSVGATQTINMVMQDDSAVTINATFDPYSAESNYYYNGYDTSGNKVSGYYDKQMTEGMINGEKFSYYHVENRSGADQLFTVSLGHGGTSNGKVYFTRPGSSDWNQNNVYAYFWKDGGSAPTAWPGNSMSWRWNNEYGQGVYSVDIPTGVDRVSFNDNSGKQTVDIDLSNTNGAYYWDGTKDGSGHYNVGTWSTGQDDQGLKNVGTEYFYSNTIYVDNFYSGGFNNHNVTNVNNFIKPKGGNGVNWDANAQKDYYIVVLYPNTTYTIDYNGHTTENTVGNDPMVIWMTELPTDDENVTVYAKDGAIRAETFGSTYANIADTKIYLNDTVVGTNHSGNITNQTYQTYKAAKGDTLVIKTQIGATDSGTLSNAAALKAKYYVRGFCVNGEVSELLEWNEDGLYSLTYKIPEDTEITKFEITPIYYLKDTTAYPIVTYRVTGFTDELKAVGAGKPGWGDTLYTYPYYGKLGGQNNAFGAYPGQPMVYYKGQYQMQIPQKSTAWDPYQETAATVNNTTVSGVTMSNGYWDSVHKSIMGYGDNSSSADHVQTYDYGDFYKIFNEKKPVDNIVFDFKYRTKKHNLVNDKTGTSIAASSLTSDYDTNGNGFELLTNFHGKNVDLFGNPLSGDAADPSKTTPIYVVSIGGVNDNVSGVENIAGYYATEWRVYAPNTPTSLTSTYKKITVGSKSSIPPEVLVLNNDDTTSFNTSTYPSADENHNVTDWKEMYTALKQYAGHPVMISYEAADAQQGQGMYYTGTGGATRNDGRWLYSKTGENITSTIKIQYSDDNGDTYTDLNTTTPQVSGLSAYFTNDGVEGQMTYSTTIDPDKTFDFEAKTTNGNYKFVGWYMKDGTKITSDNASHTERSGSYTFVAKFMKVESGQLILSHSVDTNATYKGAGTAKISAVVKDGDEVIRTYDLTTSDITMDDKIIKSDSTYTIDVTLEATATGNDTYGITTLANPSGQEAKFYKNPSTTTVDKTNTIVLDSFNVGDLFTNGTTQSVKNIIYHSYFHQTKFDYQLTFIYKDRFNESKSFTRKGQLTSAQVANTNYVQQSGNNFTLRPAFIQTVAPYESNFGEDITWNINDVSFTKSGDDYTCTADINSIQTKDTKRNVTFVLPYEHSNGIATGGNTGTAAKSTNFELIGNNAVDFDKIPVLLNDAENGIYNEEGKKNWIAAPATINDNDTTMYFQYWSVKSTSANGENDPEVARCYFQGFNFCALDNYTVTAVYGNEATDISNSSIYTGVSYLETSRNQWNDNQKRTKLEGAYASDLLFNDFILNYNFKGVDIYRGGSDTNDIKELGVVVERVQELGINQDGSKDTDISHYTSIAENRSTVEAVINGSSDKKFTKDAIDKTDLDNKNRIKFYEAFYNGKGWSMEKQSSDTKYAYKNYVYRAYTYIKYTNDQGQTVIQLSAKPAYFTMYDEAVADYVAPTTNTSGN